MNARADFSNARAVIRSVRRARSFLRPPPNLKPSEWAEANIQIPVGNAVPGPMRFDNAPYQREVIDMTVEPSCNRITLMWGAQVGKTQTALAAQAYRIGFNPVSQLMMQPSQGDLTTWLETKFNPLVDANERLQELIAKPRGRDGVNNQRMKSYPGGFANGFPVHRQGDSWAVHCDPEPICHGGSLASGSGTVNANGQELGRVGDPVDCGSSVAGGAGDVFAGD